MLTYKGPLYAKFGRRFCDTGKTASDFDRMENALKEIIELADSGDASSCRDFADKARAALAAVKE